MPNNNKIKWGIPTSADLLIAILPSVFILVIAVIYFIQLNLHLDMLVFLISPLFITYFVVRNVRLGSTYNWMDRFSIFQYSILFIIGFYSVCQYFQELKMSPEVNAAIFLGLTGFIITFIGCITLYCLIYKFERITLSKQLYEKQLQVSYEIYKDCYQLFLEVNHFIAFSYKLTAIPPQEKQAQDKIKQQYRHLLTVQKNLLTKKQASVDTHKFYLSAPLQEKIAQLFQLYQQLFAECPTQPEQIKQYEEAIEHFHTTLAQLLNQQLGVDYLYKEIQLAIKFAKKS